MNRTHTTIAMSALLLTGLVCAEPFVSEDPPFTFEIPEGWTKVPEAELQSLKDTVYGMVDDRSFEYIDAYAHDGSFLSGVYLIVQTSDHQLNGKMTWAQYESALRIGFGDVPEIIEGLNERSGGVLGSEFSGYTFEEDEQRTILRFTQNDPVLGVTYGVSYMFPGSETQVQINYYLPDGAPELLEIIEKSADTFEMGAPNTWTPGSHKPWAKYTPIIIGAVVGGLFGTLSVLRKSKK